MNNKISHDIFLIENGDLTNTSRVVFKKQLYGFSFSHYRIKYKFYTIYSFIVILFYSFGNIFGNHFDFLVDNLDIHFFNLFLFILFTTLVPFVFGFTIFSKFFNFVFISFYGFSLGCLSWELLLDIKRFDRFFYLGIFLFFLVLFVSECDYFAKVFISKQIGISTIIDLAYYFLNYIIFIGIFIFISFLIF